MTEFIKQPIAFHIGVKGSSLNDNDSISVLIDQDDEGQDMVLLTNKRGESILIPVDAWMQVSRAADSLVYDLKHAIIEGKIKEGVY